MQPGPLPLLIGGYVLMAEAVEAVAVDAVVGVVVMAEEAAEVWGYLHLLRHQ